jgi:sterol-4alpha-carboxylate 3-dehydrogenase (decarboxylating)
MAKESYLVVGGAGFLGNAIVDMLLNEGETVSVFDLVQPNDADSRLEHFYKGDITNPKDVEHACKGKTVVIHTASPIHGKPAAVYHKVNVDGTRNIIDACLAQKVSKLVYTSSAGVIYNGQDLINADETTPYCQVHMDAYNETKQLAEELVLQANCKELLTTAIRPSGIFGPRDAQGSYAIVEAARKGNWRIMIGDNMNLFDLTYVDNAAYAHILAARKLQFASGVDGEAFLITNDQPIFFWDYPKILWHALGYRGTQSVCLPKSVAYLIGDMMDFFTWVLKPIKAIHPTLTRFRVQVINGNRYFDISKAKKRLGYEPIVSLTEGMHRTSEYWKTQGYGIAA